MPSLSVDIVDQKTRSRMMAGIKSSNTRPEQLVRRELHKKGYRYRLSSSIRVRGRNRAIRPDIVLARYKVAVFVHGCYFHQHSKCKLAYSDRKYSASWADKFERNKKRDAETESILLSLGWRIVVIWECTTRNSLELERSITEIDQFINNGMPVRFETEYKEPQNI